MLQRIQTVYLLLTAVLSGVVSFLFPFWVDINGETISLLNVFEQENILFMSVPILFIGSVLLSLVALFSYKNRTRQIISNRFNIVTNFILLGIIVYRLQSLPGEINVSEKGIGVFIPLLVIVFLALANKAILKDEKLVKSVDRLR